MTAGVRLVLMFSHIMFEVKLYRALRDIRQLGLGQTSSDKGNKSGGELHLDKIDGLNMCEYYKRLVGNDSQIISE